MFSHVRSLLTRCTAVCLVTDPAHFFLHIPARFIHMKKKPDPTKTTRLNRKQLAADNEQQVANFFKMVTEAGWELYQPADWEKIVLRYRADMDIAEAVPRELMYWDIAMMHAAIESYKAQAEELAMKLKAALAKSAN